MQSEKVYWIWMATIEGITNTKFWKLIERFSSAEDVFKAEKEALVDCASLIGEQSVQALLKSRRQENIDSVADRIDQDKTTAYITPIDEEYPIKLKQIYDPPKLLFRRGKGLNSSNRLVAMVGSRKASYYGLKIAEEMAGQFAQNGIGVVSGLARGIDAASHMGALKVKGYTIGVLGCGINIAYPKENAAIYEKMTLEGTIVSEYPDNYPPRAWNFPERNRIISALADCLVLVEASEKSGAMITVDFALEQAKDVFALPGNVTSPTSRGTNQLIKEGANFVTCADDVIAYMNWSNAVPVNPLRDKQTVCQLDFLETQVYNALKDGNLTTDELVRSAELGVAELQYVLLRLELKGMIRQRPGNVYEILQ